MILFDYQIASFHTILAVIKYMPNFSITFSKQPFANRKTNFNFIKSLSKINLSHILLIFPQTLYPNIHKTFNMNRAHH